MENSTVFDSLRKRLKRRANSPEFIDDFLDEVLAFPFLDVKKGSIFLFDGSRKQLVLVAAKSSDGPQLVGLTKGLGEGVAGHVAREKTPLLVVSQQSAPIPIRSSEGKYETESFISAPIRSNGRLIGILNLTEKKSKKPFNETDLEIVMAIIDEFSANIDQAFQQKDLLDKIKALEKQMEGSQRKAGMGEIVEGVAHEINSALDAAMRFVRMAEKRSAELGDELLGECLGDAKTALERICRIAKPVNEYSRNGRKSFRETNVNDLLDGVLVLISHELRKQKIRVVKRLERTLPSISARSDLDQVPFNLIKNAREAMPEGGSLTISTSVHNGGIVMEFEDTGCGMPEDLLTKLGERGLTTKVDGTGIGLSICKEIINQHGGELIVDSKVGRGSIFTVRLPVERQKKGDSSGQEA